MLNVVEQATAIRADMDKVSGKLTDTEAANVKTMYEFWKSDTAYKKDDRRRYTETLYKCVQNHTSQSIYPPPVVPSLWAIIDNSHTGTIDDPIPAERGMEYTYGLYYLDPEDGKTYLCERAGATGGVVLQYLPHELVGQYFTEA